MQLKDLRLFSYYCCFFNFWTINQLNQGHWRVGWQAVGLAPNCFSIGEWMDYIVCHEHSKAITPAQFMDSSRKERVHAYLRENSNEAVDFSTMPLVDFSTMRLNYMSLIHEMAITTGKQ